MRRVFYIALGLLYAAVGGLLTAYLTGVIWLGAVSIAEDRLHLPLAAQIVLAVATVVFVVRLLQVPSPPQWLLQGLRQQNPQA
jgi:hypothetical protein